MSKKTVTFRLDASKAKKLDQIAAGLDRDRSYVLKEAIAAYIEVHSWQIEHIRESMKQVERGDVATAAEVKAVFSKWKK
jgi:predicted transcriptional regulator